ncbi:hypothetical protein Tco_0586889 [Tanacetum coccineum]
MLTKFVNSNTASTSGSRTLPSNTITNPKEDLKGITTRSGVAYQGPMIPTTSSSPPKVVERETEIPEFPNSQEILLNVRTVLLLDVYKGELTLRFVVGAKRSEHSILTKLRRYSLITRYDGEPVSNSLKWLVRSILKKFSVSPM